MDMAEAVDWQARATALEAELKRLMAALTPSAETRAAYIGEFRFPFAVNVPEGEIVFTPNIPWVAIKEVMAAIRAFAVDKAGGEDQ